MGVCVVELEPSILKRFRHVIKNDGSPHNSVILLGMTAVLVYK